MRMAVAVARGALALSLCAVVMTAGARSNPARGEALPTSCCDDLEERLAELETTSIRSGSHKLSFRLYGQVNRALLLWKDGFDPSDHVVDNHTSSSRFGVVGRTTIKPGLTAGYRLEIEANSPSSDEAFNAPASHAGIAVASNPQRVGQNYWTLASKDMGGLSVGYQSPATDGVTIIKLASQMNDAPVHHNNAIRMRLDLAEPAIITDLTSGQIAHNVDSLRGNFVRYDTPIINGFLPSAAVNNVWDVALRYQKDANVFRFAGCIGYQWVSFGKTTLYADYGFYRDFNIDEHLSSNPDSKLPVVWGTLTSTEVRRWGFGIERGFDAAATILYAQAHCYDP